MYSLFFLTFVGFLLSLFLTPIVRNIFYRLGVVDVPDEGRKLHDRPIPRVGGIAIALAYTLAFGLLLVTKLQAGKIIWGAWPLIWKLFPAAGLMFVTGLLDDLVRLKPWHKLLGQGAAATVAYFAGIQVLGVSGAHFGSWWWSFPATLVWLVACSNAVNLLDGVDGLAAGIALVATATTLIAAFMQHNVELALATGPLLGCLIGFLRYNFNPASIFLGDSGSLLIGFLLGCYGVLWSQKSATILGMSAPLIAFSIPLLDTSLAVARRFLRREPIFAADRGHIHHRLLERGLTPRRVALLLYGTGALAAMFSLCIENNEYELPAILAFCGMVYIGIQRLGYVEFNTAGRMFFQGAFRRLLNSQICLRSLDSSLRLATTPEQCWAILKDTYKDFGFSQIRMHLAGNNYVEGAGESRAADAWRVEICLSESDFVHLVRAAGMNPKHSETGAYVDTLQKTLEDKLPFLTPAKLAPAHAMENSEPAPQSWQVASAGD